MSAQTPSTATTGYTCSSVEQVTNARRWGIVFLLFVASMINYFDRTTMSFGIPIIAQELGLTATAKGVLLSAFFWSYALMQIPMGVLADRYNLRWVYAGAFTLWSFAQGLTGFAGSFAMLILFRIILGFGEAIYLPGGTKVVSLLFSSSERGLPCGFFDAGTRTGVVLEAVLVPWLLQSYGWRFTFAVIGFSALVWLVPWLVVTPRQLRGPATATRAPSTSLSTLLQLWPKLLSVSEYREMTRRLPAACRRYRDLFGICLGFFFFDYYWYLLLNWLPDYLVTVRHLTIIKMGIYASLPFLVFGVCQPLGGWIGDRLARAGWGEARARKVIISFGFSSGLLLIPAAQASHATTAIVLIMGGCLVGLSTANQLVVLQGCAPPDQVGTWTGIYNFVGNIAGVLAPIVTGSLIDRTGSYTPAFVLAAVMLAAGQFTYWFLVGDFKKRTEAQPGSQP